MPTRTTGQAGVPRRGDGARPCPLRPLVHRAAGWRFVRVLIAKDELLIPTLVLLFGADIKLAGSLSLVVGLPTMVVGFTRCSRDRSIAVLGPVDIGASRG